MVPSKPERKTLEKIATEEVSCQNLAAQAESLPISIQIKPGAGFHLFSAFVTSAALGSRGVNSSDLAVFSPDSSARALLLEFIDGNPFIVVHCWR